MLDGLATCVFKDGERVINNRIQKDTATKPGAAVARKLGCTCSGKLADGVMGTLFDALGYPAMYQIEPGCVIHDEG